MNNIDNLENVLIERGYPERMAVSTAKDLQKISDSLKPALKAWVESQEEPVCEAEGYSTNGLMQRFKGMTYPAALLTIDWLIRDPKKAKPIIEKGIK